MRARYQHAKTKVWYRYVEILEFSPDLAFCITFKGQRQYVSLANLQGR